jgi:hypothetical protein
LGGDAFVLVMHVLSSSVTNIRVKNIIPISQTFVQEKYAMSNVFQVQNITFLGTKYVLWFLTHDFQILPIKRKAKTNFEPIKKTNSPTFLAHEPIL